METDIVTAKRLFFVFHFALFDVSTEYECKSTWVGKQDEAYPQNVEFVLAS
jgi:hypothetical protein